jgi:hypothetical protein
MENKFVAYCDILGFSNLVLNQFDSTILIYRDFKEEITKKHYENIMISIYSDSILIEGYNLIEVAQSVQILLWTTLRYNWIVRGGLAFGKHWKESDENNLLIVSEGLVKAVGIEKKIRHPIVVVSDEIELGLDYWINGFKYSIFDLPIIHYDNINIVNPFNNYWFQSAEIKLNELKSKYLEHSSKYEYLLTMINNIKNFKEFVPQDIIEELVHLGVIKKT